MMTTPELIARTEQLLLAKAHVRLEKASAVQLHDALSTAAMRP